MKNSPDKEDRELKAIREKLECFLGYSKQKELPLKDIEKLMINSLGCIKEKSKGGSSIKYSHPSLEKNKFFTNGIFSVHIIHGKSKDKPMIRRKDFKLYLWPALKFILDELEGGKNV